MGVVSTFREWLPRPAGLLGNRERGRLEVHALGQAWVLRLNMNHLIGLCEHLGIEDKDMSRTLAEVSLNMDTLRGRRAAYVFALHVQHPEVTEEQAGEIITELGYIRSGDVIVDVLRWAMPEPEKEDAERGKGQAVPSPPDAGATSS